MTVPTAAPAAPTISGSPPATGRDCGNCTKRNGGCLEETAPRPASRGVTLHLLFQPSSQLPQGAYAMKYGIAVVKISNERQGLISVARPPKLHSARDHAQILGAAHLNSGNTMDLNGKVAFVTGGSGDIGKAIALALARAGTDIVVSYVGDVGRADAAVEAIRKTGRQGHAVHLDQRDSGSIDACVEKVMGHFGRLDILVNNAAWNVGIPFRDLEALTSDIWDRVLETNTRGPFLLSRAFAPELRRHKAGRIVNIASLAGLAPAGSSIAYAASKSALIHLTHCLAVALAPDVTVNCIAPGLVEGTRMAGRLPEEVKQSARSQAILGRTGSADDIAQMAVAYCRADSMTGQTVVVDGGAAPGMR